jgi:hypothetical protein
MSLPARNTLPPWQRLQPKNRKWHQGECLALHKNARLHVLSREKHPQWVGVKWVGIPMSPCLVKLEILLNEINGRNK